MSKSVVLDEIRVDTFWILCYYLSTMENYIITTDMTADVPEQMLATEKDFHVLDMSYVLDGVLYDGKTTPYLSVKDFYDITIGVISGGYVGKHMVKLLKNFHVDVLLYDPILSAEQIAEIGATKVELNELLSRSDVVTIHAPAIPATENMLHKDNLCLMQDGAILINTARGTIVNEKDLIAELKKGRIFACIDVTNPEPPAKDNELRALKNVVLTPHIAGTATNGLKRVALHVCEEIERLLNGEKMRTEVNLDELSKLA